MILRDKILKLVSLMEPLLNIYDKSADDTYGSLNVNLLHTEYPKVLIWAPYIFVILWQVIRCD